LDASKESGSGETARPVPASSAEAFSFAGVQRPALGTL
jgi:hypothetical protein